MLKRCPMSILKFRLVSSQNKRICFQSEGADEEGTQLSCTTATEMSVKLS